MLCISCFLLFLLKWWPNKTYDMIVCNLRTSIVCIKAWYTVQYVVPLCHTLLSKFRAWESESTETHVDTWTFSSVPALSFNEADVIGPGSLGWIIKPSAAQSTVKVEEDCEFSPSMKCYKRTTYILKTAKRVERKFMLWPWKTHSESLVLLSLVSSDLQGRFWRVATSFPGTVWRKGSGRIFSHFLPTGLLHRSGPRIAGRFLLFWMLKCCKTVQRGGLVILGQLRVSLLFTRVVWGWAMNTFTRWPGWVLGQNCLLLFLTAASLKFWMNPHGLGLCKAAVTRQYWNPQSCCAKTTDEALGVFRSFSSEKIKIIIALWSYFLISMPYLMWSLLHILK